jgi:hypothetical protein
MIIQSKSTLFLYSFSFVSYLIVACFYTDLAIAASSNRTLNERYKGVKNTITERNKSVDSTTNNSEPNNAIDSTTNELESYKVANRTINDGESCETEVADSDEDILIIKNKRYKAVDGDVYKCQKGKWVFAKTLKEERFKNIRVLKTAKGCEAHNIKTGEIIQIGDTTNFSTGFEEPKFLELFHDKKWSLITLLSPKADSVQKYTKLNKQIMSGGNFLDNRIDLETRNVHSGNHALRFFAVAPSSAMKGRDNPSKSLIEKKKIFFAKGDDIWYSGWYYFEKGMPSTIVDIETRLFKLGPGIRLFIRDGKYASMELKFAGKPQYNQTKVVMPRQKWVHIKLHLKLSSHNDGVIELWQDGEKILSTTGRTLPTYDSVYNAIQVGITATSVETVLIVDDVQISDHPID